MIRDRLRGWNGEKAAKEWEASKTDDEDSRRFQGEEAFELEASAKNPGQRPVRADRVEFSPDGRQVFAAGFMGTAFSQWDLGDKSHLLIPSTTTRNRALSPGAKKIAVGSWASPDPNAVIILNVPSGRLAGIVRPLVDIWLRMRWSPDGKWIDVVSNYGRVLCFNASQVLGRGVE